MKLWPDPKMNLCCVVKLWWSQFHKFWKLWNCASQFVMFVKLWFAHFEFWKPLKNLSFAMNGFEESYYTIPKSNISRLKIYNCSLRSIFFKIFCDACSKNQIVLCCEIVSFHNHNFTISQIHNFTIIFYNSDLDRKWPVVEYKIKER